MQYQSQSVLKVLLLSISVVLSTPVIAKVESIASEQLEQSSGDTFWQSHVKCRARSEVIVIQQVGAQSDWCVSEAKQSCKPSKEQLAKLICEDSFLDNFFRTKPVQQTPQKETTPRYSSKPSSTSSTDLANNNESTVNKSPQVLPRILPNRPGRQSQDKSDSVVDTKVLEDTNRLQKERVAINREKYELQELESKLRARSLEIKTELKKLE